MKILLIAVILGIIGGLFLVFNHDESESTYTEEKQTIQVPTTGSTTGSSKTDELKKKIDAILFN